MKLDIQKERDTPLLARTRFTLSAEYSGATPSRRDFLKEVSKKLKSNEKLTVIRHVYSKFGRQKAKVIVHVYEDADAMKRLEGEGLIKKHQAPPKKEAPAVEKKEEAAEKKKEEAPAEEKKESPAEEKKEEAPTAPAEKKGAADSKAPAKGAESKPASAQPAEEKSE